MCRFFRASHLCLVCLIVLFSTPVYSQADLSGSISAWKTLFPKEDVIASAYKETISFFLNENPKPGEGSVGAKVINELTIAPVKDFMTQII